MLFRRSHWAGVIGNAVVRLGAAGVACRRECSREARTGSRGEDHLALGELRYGVGVGYGLLAVEEGRVVEMCRDYCRREIYVSVKYGLGMVHREDA